MREPDPKDYGYDEKGNWRGRYATAMNLYLGKLERQKMLIIDSGYFYAGAVFEKNSNDVWGCIQAAPIINYMIGWDLQKTVDYIEKKKWKIIKKEK